VVDDALRVRLGQAEVEEAQARTWARTAHDLLAAYDRAASFAARR
jgi:hypothetical protein